MTKRNTPAKQMVRELLYASASAMSQDMLEAELQNKVDRVTIYRILASFCEDGLVHRVTAQDGKAYYALCTGCKEAKHQHDHAHFQCLKCKRVECMPFSVNPELPKGYSAAAMNFWISGSCNKCD